MYQVFCDDLLIYSTTIESLKLVAPRVGLEVNRTGSFTFQIFPTHPYYSQLQKLKSIIKVYQDDYLIFKGRILDDEVGFYNQKQVTCEGELAFLLDSIQRPYSYESNIPEYFTQLITIHNTQVDAEHRFKVGNITVTDPNSYISRSDTTYQNTFDALTSKLIDTHGGYLWVRHEEDGNYLDYLEDFTTLSNQPVAFGSNLLDLKKKVKGADIATAIIPLGYKDEETGVRVDIKSVNNNVDYVFNQDAVDLYGWIFKVQTWDDVTLPANLLTKANEYLTTTVNLSTEIELSAVDLSSLNADFNAFHLGTYVQVNAGPQGINQNFPVKKLEIDLSNPTSNKLTLGTIFSSFTEQTIESTKKQGDVIEVVENVVSNIRSYAEQAAQSAETNAKAYADGQLNTFASTVNNDITNLQNQIDGSITTWFYATAPSISNVPANEWVTTDEKNRHLGDLYYDTVTGYSYRWQVVNNVYSWQIITDTDVTKALQDAAKAQDTADGKRRVFSSQPAPPYDLNDLWVQGTSGDIMRCTVAKTTGSYAASDWVKASKYTDDTTVNNLTIGGRNLIPGTSQMETVDGWTYNGGYPGLFEFDTKANRIVVIGSNGMERWVGSPAITVEAGKTYTISVLAKAENLNLGLIVPLFYDGTWKNYNYLDKDTVGKFVKKVFTVTPTTSGALRVALDNKNNTTGKAYYSLLMVELGNKATDWTPAPEDAKNYTNAVVNQLSQNLNSSIEQTSTNIRMDIAEEFYTKGEASQLVESIGTEFSQTKNDFEFKFNTFNTSLNDLTSGTGAQFSEINKYIRFEDGNIVLGESGNELILKIQNDRISFLQNNVEVAYLSNKKLYVTDGEYLNSLKIGSYAFVPNENGNLSFIRVV